MIAVGESREEVVEMLKKDVYTKEGVWDWDKVGCLLRWKGEGGRERAWERARRKGS